MSIIDFGSESPSASAFPPRGRGIRAQRQPPTLTTTQTTEATHPKAMPPKNDAPKVTNRYYQRVGF